MLVGFAALDAVLEFRSCQYVAQLDKNVKQRRSSECRRGDRVLRSAYRWLEKSYLDHGNIPSSGCRHSERLLRSGVPHGEGWRARCDM